MAYEKQNFLDGQIITADHLNHMENGIITAQNPRNLLDNSDFTNPVNQRNATSGDYSWKYAIDRWMLNGSGFVIDENGITIPAGGRLVQRHAAGVIAADDGRTLAVQLADGSVFAATSATQYGDLYLSKGSTDAYSTVNIENKGSGTITVQWAALYEGSYDASTLPPYVPKGYVSEMAECHRYYYKTVSSNWDGSVCNAIGSNAYAPLYITFPVPMRITPTVSNGVSSCDVFGTGTVSASITNTSVDRWHYTCMATVSSSYGGKIIKPIGRVEFSADL